MASPHTQSQSLTKAQIAPKDASPSRIIPTSSTSIPPPQNVTTAPSRIRNWSSLRSGLPPGSTWSPAKASALDLS